MYSTPDTWTDAPAPDAPAGEGALWSEAAQYVRDRWRDFLELSPKIIDLQHRAALAAQAYQEQGRTELANAAKALIRELGALNQLHGKIVDRFSDAAEYVGLGAIQIPVVLATAFSAAAIALLWFFRKMDIQEQALEQLEAGTLTEAGFLEMNRELGQSPLRETLDFAKLALWAFVGWLGLQAVQTFRPNPPLVVFGNPPGTLSHDVVDIRYIHAEDGRAYVHEFEGDVEAEALPDGSLLIHHPDKPVWGDFS